MIKVSIDSPDISLTDGMKEAVQKTADKIEKYIDGLSIDCVIRKMPKKGVHILLKFKPLHGAQIQAESLSGDFYFYKGLTQAQKRLVRQVTDLKDKETDDKKHSSEGVIDLILEIEDSKKINEDLEAA